MTRSEPLLAVADVSRRFGYRKVIEQVSFEVGGGDVLLLIGHNGAGKTTLIRLLAGLLSPNEGTVSRCDSFGVVTHDSMLYDSLSARENLQFYGRLYGRHDAAQLDDLLRRVGLHEHADRHVITYSRGMVQRLALARALLPDPDLLLLDEPLTGLDDSASGMVREILSEFRTRNRAVVLTTHQLADVVDLATDVGYMVAGKLTAIEPVEGRDARAVTMRYRELASNV
jgi:heme exporter protein A